MELSACRTSDQRKEGEMNNNLGAILRARRKEKGLTLTQLSSLSGLHTAHIGRIETGERFPKGSTLSKLAEPLGFSEFELCRLAGFISQDAVDGVECSYCGGLNPVDVTRCIHCLRNVRG
ncbi:hypothetical protein ES703_40933 [subsurface metagenome]